MVLAVAFEEAKTKQLRVEGNPNRGNTGGILQTPFFGSRKTPDLPQAKLSQYDPGRYDGPHFHIVDQFQIVVRGKGKLGRHDLTPYGVHFSRAFTPYGPLLSDADAGFSLFVLRRRADPGSQRLPKERDRLKQVADRRPWQITRSVTFSDPPSQSGTASIVLQPISGLTDDRGLAGYTLSMRPHAQTYAPDPAAGDGQYLVVLEGSLLHDNKNYVAPALIFVWPYEDALQIHAGPTGLQALVLNFPRPQAQPTHTSPQAQVGNGFKIWQCTLCAFTYDEAAGLPHDGIAPGTRWEDVPHAWSCPDCSASKADFQNL